MKKSPVTRSPLRQFFSYYRPHKKLFALDMICALLIAVIDLSFPIVSRYAMSELLPGKLFGHFFVLMGTLVVAYLLRAVFEYIVTYWGHTLGVRMEADMRRIEHWMNNYPRRMFGYITADEVFAA